jgi:hypothetical protein
VVSPQWPLVLWYDHFLGDVVEVAAALLDTEVEVENPAAADDDGDDDDVASLLLPLLVMTFIVMAPFCASSNTSFLPWPPLLLSLRA